MSQLLGTDYETQKIRNMNTLKQKYDSKLEEYRTAFNTYLTYKYDTSADKAAKQLQAEETWRPKTEALNDELNAILDEVRKNIQETQALIEKQKGEVNNKTAMIYDKNKEIETQDKAIRVRNQELLSKDRQVQFTSERNKYRRIIMVSLLAANVAIIGGAVLYFYKNKSAASV